MIEVQLARATVVFTGREGGVSAPPYASLNLGPWTADDPDAVAENLRRAGALAGAAPAYARQVHGTRVTVRTMPGEGEEADGQATTAPDVAPMVLTADCLPVAIVGAEAVAMVHAGWRGLAGGVLEEGVRVLRGLGATGELEAVIGPGAGACCYEVGPEVAARFPDSALRGRHLDLKAVATARLGVRGVTRVQDVGRCTMCEPHVFFSHRAGGSITGRNGGLVRRTCAR